jgi:hypothetical protein
MVDMPDLRYPVGPFSFDKAGAESRRGASIKQIAEAPSLLRAALKDLDERQFDTPYRPGGWTVRQVAHHLPDSHMNAYCRFKWALTESDPTIKPYDEAAWANLADTARTSPLVSVTLLESLHVRWVSLLESMTAADFERPLRHPEHGPISLDWMLQMYAWHGRHHVAHVTSLRSREGW